MGIFHVRFFNPQTKLLHSSAVVDVDHPGNAVRAAIDQIGNDALASYDAGVTDTDGNGVAGLEKAISVQAIKSRMEELGRQLEMLTGAPAPVNEGAIPAKMPTLVQNTSPTSMEVTPTGSQQINAGAFTQADIDAAREQGRRDAQSAMPQK